MAWLDVYVTTFAARCRACQPRLKGQEVKNMEEPVQVFVDMDGVLADFDLHYETHFGTRPCKKSDNVNWKAVQAVKGFNLNIPPMADLEALWARIERHNPIVLTGTPSSVPEAADNKRAWARKHLGEDVRVICCQAKEKYMHASRGDILIDDRMKYKDLWVAAGGRWITHVSAADTARQLSEMGL